MANRVAMVIFAGLILTLFPGAAWAIQSHSSPEGLYSHQMAHIFFAFSMGLLIYWLRKRDLTASRAWRMIQYAALFFIIWNGVAFAGHWLEEQSGWIEVQRTGLMHIAVFVRRGPESLRWLYYLLKLDHLFSVPAMVFLFLGLRRLLQEPAQEEKAPWT